MNEEQLNTVKRRIKKLLALSKVWQNIRINWNDSTAVYEACQSAIALAEEAVQCAAVCERFIAWKDIKDKSKLIERLGKAKKILNNFLNACEDYEISEARAEARQFLDGEGCPDCFCEDCTKDCEAKKLGIEIESTSE